MKLVHRPPSRPALTLSQARHLVDDTTGIIRLLYEAPLSPGAPRIFGFGSLCRDESMRDAPGEGGAYAKSSVSGSTSITRDQAIAGAIGETVERYSAAFVPEDAVRHASYRELADTGEPVVAPTALTLYDEAQYTDPAFGYNLPASTDVMGWVAGYSLNRRMAVWLPAFAVYQPYPSSPQEPPVVQQVTTGLACGNTLEEAIYSAMCEVVERDAAMLMWLQSRRAPRVDLATVGAGPARAVLTRFGELQRNLTLLDVTTDFHIPAYVAMWDGPIYGASGAIFASCAKLDCQRAAAGALTELAQCLTWAASLIDRGTSLRDPQEQPLSEIEEHVMWPLLPTSRPAFAFVGQSQRTCHLPAHGVTGVSVLADIETCVERIAARDGEVIVVDVTSPDIRSCGLFVVRAVIPGAQPLFFGSGLHRISHRAHAAAYPDRASSAINFHPHPFP